MDVVLPGHLHTTPDLAEARDIVRRNQGVFGTGHTPRDVLRVLEWFVAPPLEMVLLDQPGGKLSATDGCVCIGDAMQFVGMVVDMSVPKQVGFLQYDFDLTPGAERIHLELYLKDEVPPHPPQSMTPQLKRCYEAMVRAGIGVLDLEAGLQSGPTFWAHAGVEFRSGRPLLAHLEVLAMLLAGSTTPPTFATPDDVRRNSPAGTASIEEAYGLSVALSNITTTPIWVMNPLRHKPDNLGIPVDVQRPIGEAILFAIGPWDGRVDLSDPGVSDTRFRAFLGI